MTYDCCAIYIEKSEFNKKHQGTNLHIESRQIQDLKDTKCEAFLLII